MKNTINPQEIDSGLRKLSSIISEEQRKLIPNPYNVKSDADRMDELWRKYSRTGIFMSNGGVGKSFIDADDLLVLVKEPENLKSFNLYRTDRPKSTILKQDKIKKFLLDDEIVSEKADLSQVFPQYSLGSHEGFTRLLRCLHEEDSKLFYPVGGYSLLIRAAAAPEVGQYSVQLVDVDREIGEKVSIESLGAEMSKHKKSKVVYLESKTMCGSIYNREELERVVDLCKSQDAFLIFDSAHANMEFEAKNKFPDLVSVCQERGYNKYGLIITGSKTYGLERGRVGFVVFGDEKMATRFSKDLGKTIGSMLDLPIELANILIESDPSARKQFLDERRECHRDNMNLLIGYIQGVNGPDIDESYRAKVSEEIPERYRDGIEGMKLIYKPDGGIQLKVDVEGLKDKYFGNVRMFNSEILSYALNSTTNVVTLHSYQLADYSGYAMRLSFSIREDIHLGMQKMHDFVKDALTETPQPNPYMPNIALAEEIIFPTAKEIEDVVLKSRTERDKLDNDNLMKGYKDNVRQGVPSYIKLTDEQLGESVSRAASVVQRFAKSSFEPKSSQSLVPKNELSKNHK